MGVFIGGVVTGVLIALAALLLIFIGLIVADDGFVDMPPDPTYHPAGWKEWHEARQGGRES